MTLTLRIVVLVAVVLMTARVVPAAENGLVLPSKSKLHLFLLIGQSNMAGRGEVEARDRVSHPRVLMFTRENAWVHAVDPVHFDKSSAGVGLASTFARVLADADPDVTIGLVPCAVGNTALSTWEKEGNNYVQALARARLAQRDGEIKGILWHQGEAEGGDPQRVLTYAARLERMIADLRRDLGAGDVPFVAGKLGEFSQSADTRVKATGRSSVNAQLEIAAKETRNMMVVESRGLRDKGDHLHFDSPSLREFGRRYAAAYLALSRGAETPHTSFPGK